MARTAHHRRGITGVTIGIAAVIVLGGCANSNADAPETSSLGSGIGSGVTTTAVAEASTPSSAAAELLAQIPIKGRAPKTGYDRALFGTAWTDDVTVEFGHNGCDTRIICTQF
ncbi:MULTISPECIES: hypothetical protein [Rhodococcus]|jgi:hypothetical protein|uniref:Lipoprotein n=1 Tax=Rhodococcus baikonurensis TaxID=172041 RepID=A0ABV5XB63_9NOCA|nr:hypothetical protein [Rhodococcus sp. P-2]